MNDEELEYCKQIVSGRTPKDAYIKAFNVKDLGSDALRKRISRLSQKDEIRAEIDRLEKAVKTPVVLKKDLPVILSRQELMCKVLSVADNAERDGDRLKGYELYAKLAGYGQPEQAVQVNVGVGLSMSELVNKATKNANSDK